MEFYVGILSIPQDGEWAPQTGEVELVTFVNKITSVSDICMLITQSHVYNTITTVLVLDHLI